MPRRPGRDQGLAAKRHLRLLTRLAQAAPGWVNRDALMGELGYGAKAPRDQIARDVRILLGRGWAIEKTGEGDEMRYRLVEQDPRLRTLLSEDEIRELSRAVRIAGHRPADLGLPDTGSLPTAGSPVNTDLTTALIVEDLIHAWRYRCIVSLHYKGTVRDVHVDEIRRTSTGRWRLIAREGDVQKFFRLDRIEELRVGRPDSATPPQPVVKDSDPLTIPDGQPVAAVVRTTREHLARVVRDLGEPTEEVEDEQGLRLCIPVINHWLWRQRLYQLGTRVLLEGPADLRDEVRSDLEQFVVDAP